METVPASPTVHATRPSSIIAEDADIEKESVHEKTDQHTTVEATPVVDYGPPPDGGFRAWLVVLGCAATGFCSFGFANAFGVFQSYYTETVPGASQFAIAWIGSLQYSLIFLPGLLAGHWVDRGYFRPMILVFSSTLVISLFLVAECTKLWQLILCQGIAIGGSSGFLFMPSLGMIPHWFNQRRSIAYGVLALGSSLGGTIFPIVVRKLLKAVGFKWTIRTLAFIITALLVFVNLTVRPRVLIKRNTNKMPLRELLTNRPLMLYIAGVSFIWLGIYVPLIFMDVFAKSIGIDESISYYTLVTANAASIIGRLGGGYFGDRFGPLNMMTTVCAASAILTIAWPYTKSFATLEVVSVLYGIASGGFVGLLPAPTSRMVPMNQIGVAIGLTGTCMSIGALVGNPIAGQVLEAQGFKVMGGYSGAMVLFSCGLCLLARWDVLGKWHGKF